MPVGKMEVSTQNFLPGLSHLHTNGRLPWQSLWLICGKGWRENGDSLLPSIPGTYLVWRPPVTCTWSSSLKGWVGEYRVCHSCKGWMEPVPAGETEQAMSNKAPFSQPALSLLSFSFIRFIEHLPLAGNLLTPSYFQITPYSSLLPTSANTQTNVTLYVNYISANIKQRPQRVLLLSLSLSTW